MKQTKPYLKSRRQGATFRRKAHHRLKLALVPHKANQYRPHLIRPFGLIAVIVIALSIPALSNQLSSGSVLGTQNSVTPSQLYAGTNSVRKTHGLAPLEANSELSKAALEKANDMFKNNYWAHVSPSGVTPWHWFKAEKYNYSAAGENLAKNFTSSSGVMSAWMASPEHRANILDDNYSDIGIAVVNGMLDGEPTQLVVAEYGHPQTSAFAAPASAVLAAQDGQLTPWQRLDVVIHTVSPAVMGAIVLLLVAAIVAAAAHTYRKKLPVAWRTSWRHHHGLYKTLGLVSLVVVILSTYSGGQI